MGSDAEADLLSRCATGWLRQGSLPLATGNHRLPASSAGVATASPRRYTGEAPMLIRSTWEPHRSPPGESPSRRRSRSWGGAGAVWAAAAGSGAASGCGDRRWSWRDTPGQIGVSRVVGAFSTEQSHLIRLGAQGRKGGPSRQGPPLRSLAPTEAFRLELNPNRDSFAGMTLLSDSDERRRRMNMTFRRWLALLGSCCVLACPSLNRAAVNPTTTPDTFYTTGSTRKICQLVGDTDFQWLTPTENLTETRAGILRHRPRRFLRAQWRDLRGVRRYVGRSLGRPRSHRVHHGHEPGGRHWAYLLHRRLGVPPHHAYRASPTARSTCRWTASA